MYICCLKRTNGSTNVPPSYRPDKVYQSGCAGSRDPVRDASKSRCSAIAEMADSHEDASDLSQQGSSRPDAPRLMTGLLGPWSDTEKTGLH